MRPSADSYSRYLPPDPDAAGWGWQLLDAGRQSILPGAAYPGSGHPLGYLFGPSGRRTLDEFQIVYLSRGEGRFESASMPEQAVIGGTAMLLFPGEWHRYHPLPETGWTEHWIGFRGREASRVMERFFSPKAPRRAVSESVGLLQIFDQLRHWLAQSAEGREQIAAAHIPLALAFLRAGPGLPEARPQRGAEWVRRAREAMLRNPAERTDFEALAVDLGCSYSAFRSLFKKQTGHAPREYENRIRLNRSRDLLRGEGATVSGTAYALGYSSVYYFSRAFKKRFGMSPRAWIDARSR